MRYPIKALKRLRAQNLGSNSKNCADWWTCQEVHDASQPFMR